MVSNNLLFFFALILFSFFLNKYSFLILKKINLKLLIDDQFEKPQAFHKSPIPLLGGVSIFLSFSLVYLYLFFFKNIVLYEYLTFCTLFFFLGFTEDLRINLKPKIRLFLMIFLLILLVKYHNFYIKSTGIELLDNWIMNSNFFALFFVCLCFLFMVNGANLIDGYNGLLSIHSLIILINLFFINYLTKNYDLAILLFSGILILLIFLKFNFPNAKSFLGDGGAYFLGIFLAISVIKTSIANPTISPFFFCILLFYLFFEVFFSFLRKLIIEKRSPIYPDNKHLHMIFYKILCKKNDHKWKSNYQVSIIINLIYLILIIPAILMMNSGLFCKYYSLLFFIIYIYSYKIAVSKKTLQ